jgi:hypothetical protein
MPPLLLVIGLCLCALAIMALAVIGIDNWRRGNRWFATVVLALGLMGALLLDRTMDEIERAYVERAGRQP